MSSTQTSKDYLGAVTQSIQGNRRVVLNPAERYLDRAPNLPPAPMLVTQLLELFRQPDHDVDQIVQLVSYEPALTAQILRTCNSACFAGEQPPSDIFEAVTRLGFYQVYCLVVSLFGAKTKAIKGAAEGVDVQDLWRHSVAVAIASSVVEEAVGEMKAAAFTAGLLHDIGKLVIASVEGGRYAVIITEAKEKGEALTTREAAAFGMDHAELGGELLRRWNLPADIVASVRHHHDSGAAPEFAQLTAAVQLGDIIAHQLYQEDLAKTALVASSNAPLEALGIRPDDLPNLVAKTKAEMEKVKGLLSI